MADSTIAAFTEDTAPLGTDIVWVVHTPATTPADRKVQIANLLKGDSSWTNVTFTNSWTDYDTVNWGPCSYRKDGAGWVHLRGLVKSGTNNAAIFTLPTGYRPEFNMLIASWGNNGTNDVALRINIAPTGAVSVDSHVVANSYVSLVLPPWYGT